MPRPTYSDEKKTVEFENNLWVADGADRVTATEFNGKHALNVRGGVYSYVYLPGVAFRDGTIEVDLAADSRGVPGIGFRGCQNGQRVAKVAFAPFHAGSSTPEGSIEQAVLTRNNGTYLLLRMGPTVKAAEWFHVKLVIQGEGLEVYVNDGREPVFVVDHVLDGKARGNVGIWGLRNAYFANFRYTPAN